ncbi:MAG: hypothetical protein Q9192_006568, partial [Flavoplaca navasiana]
MDAAQYVPALSFIPRFVGQESDVLTFTTEDEGELMRTSLDDTPKCDEHATGIFNKWFETESATNSRINEDSHTLDHKIPCGDDSRWSTMWADYLCGDFSSLSPLRLLSERGGEAANENSAAALLTTIWQKIRQSTGDNHSPSNVVNDDAVPPYAHESTTYFIE